MIPRAANSYPKAVKAVRTARAVRAFKAVKAAMAVRIARTARANKAVSSCYFLADSVGNSTLGEKITFSW